MSPFEVCWFPTDLCWHQPTGATKHQRFAQKAFVKQYRAIDICDAVLIGPVLEAAVHTLEPPLGMKQARRQGPGIVGRGEAQYVGIEQQTATLASAKRVAIDSHDASHSTAIGVEG